MRGGEPVRLTHVLDAVEPRARTDGRPAFPLEHRAGEGRTNRLDDVVVFSCLDFPAEERTLHEQESVVDLAGPGAALTPYAAGTNVVLSFRRRDDLGNEELEAWARRTTLAVAEELARPTLDAQPAELERFELGAVDTSLPAIAALVQLSDLGPLYYQFVYGVPAGEAGLPRVVDPAELLDGAVTCGEYHWAALRNPTIVFQRNALVRALYREHGRRLRFAGLVLMRGYEQSAADKQRAAAAAAEKAAGLGADGAIVTTDAGGNSHTDVMLTVRACEEAGIRTTAIVAEMADPDVDELRTHRLGTGGGLDRLGRQRGGAGPRVDAGARARRRHAARWSTGRRSGADPCEELPRRDQPDRPTYPDRGDMVRAVHYLNQFFAGLGGEEAAGTPPTRLDGPVGPGRGLAAELDGIEIVATLACGDDYFGEHEEEALARLLDLLEAERPDLLVAGPAFGSGRYGLACARISRAAAERLGIPSLAAMHEENPGVAAADGAVLVAATAGNVAGMREALPRMARLAEALVSGRELGPPAEEGYLPRGFRRNEIAEKPGAERALDLLLAKLAGDIRSEVAGGFDRVTPPPPVGDLSRALVALVTEAGCVPQGNPDRLPTIRAQGWLRYELGDAPRLESGSYESVHGGFDVSLANEDPNRLVPLDTVRALVAEGRLGRLHDVFYTTTGNGTPVAAATRFGREIAAELTDAGVEAVLLSGT